MNSRKTLTCNILHLPQDIFRVIFQYLSAKDLMKGEEAFLNNQELLSLYRSSLEGFTLKEKITNQFQEGKESIYWIIDSKLLIEMLELCNLSDLKMRLLSQIRFSLKSINFAWINSYSDNSDPVISQLGHFPSLTSVTFYNSRYFTNEILLSFFSHNPQVEIVQIENMQHLSNEILPHLSDYCPKIKILSLYWSNWVNDETMSLLIEQRLFPNLKSLDLRRTRVTNQESLRQFILSRSLLCGLSLPDDIEYSDDFLLFYLRQVIFPSILSHDNHNDLESHSLAISSLYVFVERSIFYEDDFVVTPELFSVDILSHLYYKGCSYKTLYETTQIFFQLSKFPSMIDSILQSQFIPILLNDTSPHDSLPSYCLFYLLFRCGVFHDYFPLLVEKYQTHPSSLIEICHRAIEDQFSLLKTEQLQTIISIVLNYVPDKDSSCHCLKIISKLLQEPSSQLLIDPNDLLLSLKSIKILSNYAEKYLFECLKRFVSFNENYHQLFIESNLLPQVMTLLETQYLVLFAKHCLASSGDGLLVDHLVDSGLFQYLLSKYRYADTETVSLFKVLIEFNNNKYFEIVKEMKLPNELRVKLFEKGYGICLMC